MSGGLLVQLHLISMPCTERGTISVQGGLLVAGTDGPGGQVTPAPMVRGTINFIPDMDGRGGGRPSAVA